MKNIFKAILIFLVIPLASCELFQQQEDTLNPQKGLLDIPNIQLNGESFLVFDIREAPFPPYVDAGAEAYSGPIEVANPNVITSEMTTTGADLVDPNTPGFYTIDYSVTTTDVLGNEVTATAQRTVAVTNPDDDLSGTWTLSTTNAGWNGTGTNSNGTPPPHVFSQLGTARFLIPPYFNGGLGGNELDRSVELRIASDVILLPTHGSQFGISWGGAGAVVSRDPVTNQVTEFWFDWNSPSGFNGGAIMARNTYTR